MDSRTQLASMALEEADRGDFLMAIRMLNTSIRLEPDNYELYLERSICHLKLGDHQASLDDANAAIRRNPNGFDLHYQKGLAQCGLSMFHEAIASFKKAIELRAQREDTKLSHIFQLVKDAIKELHTSRDASKRVNTTSINASNLPCNRQDRRDEDPNQTSRTHEIEAGTSRTGRIGNDAVDSTTDRPSAVETTNPAQSGTMFTHHHHPESHGNSDLVATNNNDKLNNGHHITMQDLHRSKGPNGVTSSALNDQAGHLQQTHILIPANMIPENSTGPLYPLKQQTPPAYDWNIRRSERIFFSTGSSLNPSDPSRQRTASNASSSHSGRTTGSRRTQNQANRLSCKRMRDASSSHADSDVDVDDSGATTDLQNMTRVSGDQNHQEPPTKRVMIAPSSSMPALSAPSTSSGTVSTAITKEDYSSKYKRLRRDRERARRGTSKLCTIKPSDLEELTKQGSADKRFMRVIAPIDGWLYSGQLSVDETSDQTSSMGPSTTPLPSSYIVRLDGDTRGNSYVFSLDTVLNDVIKEVRVNSVSDLRKGARICCYWSRQYKCLSTGVVTSRTFEATKSLVSVKYDNGDLSALPLEDLRLLPPDYPKYMSNCDPLVLATTLNGVGGGLGPARQMVPTTMAAGPATIMTGAQQSAASPRSGSGMAGQEQLPSDNKIVTHHQHNNLMSLNHLHQHHDQAPTPVHQQNSHQPSGELDPLNIIRNSQSTDGASLSTSLHDQVAQNLPTTINRETDHDVIDGERLVHRYNGDSFNHNDEEHRHQLEDSVGTGSVDRIAVKTMFLQQQHTPSEHQDTRHNTDEQPVARDPTSASSFKDNIDGGPQVAANQSDSPRDEVELKHASSGGRVLEGQMFDDDDSTIPPTDDIIDFVTRETAMDGADSDSSDKYKYSTNSEPGTETKTPLATAQDNLANKANKTEPLSTGLSANGVEYKPWMFEGPPRRSKRNGRTYRDNYMAIRRGNEVLRVGDSAELMPRDESILPFIAKIDGLWATARGEMRVRVRWYYRLCETDGKPVKLRDGEQALFQTDHFDENDVQSIYRAARILSWTEYCRERAAQFESSGSMQPIDSPNGEVSKMFYLAGYYDPVRRVKHLSADVKEELSI